MITLAAPAGSRLWRTQPSLAALCALLLAVAPFPVSAQALSPAFTYQGELRLASGAATASFDMQFRLYNAQSDGTQIGVTVTASNVAVSDGLFSVALDFGPGQFAGERQWLEIAIRPAGVGSYETLAPRTELTATPYALGAAAALANSVTTTSIVDGAIGTADINAAQIQRRVSDNCVVGQYVRAINQDGSVACGTDANSGGTVTSIATGAGLTGGPITSSGSVAVAAGGIGVMQINAAEVQRRVSGSCPAGQYVRIVNQDGTVACGTDNPGPLGWDLSGNTGTNPATHFVGTVDAQPFVVRTHNAQSLRIEPSADLFNGLPITTNWIAGSSANNVTTGVRGATISGGGVPAGGSDPIYAAQDPNRVTDHYGSVGGGYANRAGNDAGSLTDAGFATVGGGYLNRAGGEGSTAGGGRSNAASGNDSTVGGGSGSTASGSSSTVSGGGNNTASGSSSAIGGGRNNSASGINSTIGGGSQNSAVGVDSTVGGGLINSSGGVRSSVGGGVFNTASGDESTVGGGISNTAAGNQSTVGGGSNNVASGLRSRSSGGGLNCAGGAYAWAGGFRAKVRPATDPGSGSCSGLSYPGGNGDLGSFVWADSQDADFVSTGGNQFLVRAAGGMAINTNTPAAGRALTVNGAVALNGAVELNGSVALNGDVALATNHNLSFGSQTRQMLNLFGTGYGIGVQNGRLYFRVNPIDGFAWYQGGEHSSGMDDPGAGGTMRMRLSSEGQLQTSTGTISALSDARLKEQVADYSGALDRINALRPVTYRYLDAGKAAFRPQGTHIGFLAQEVQQVFPQWVSADDDGHLMLSLRGFEAVAVRAMQELSAENAQLREGQARLIEENAALQARLAAIEAKLGIASDGAP